MKTRHVVGATLVLSLLAQQAYASGLEDALAHLHMTTESCGGTTQLFKETALVDFADLPHTDGIEQQIAIFESAVRTLAQKLQYHTCVRVAVLPLSGPFEGFAVPASPAVGPWPWVIANTHELKSLSLIEIHELAAHEFAHIVAGHSETGNAHWSEWNRLLDEYKALLSEQAPVVQH
jgi:Zn-dependent protease with chaperone function